MSEITKALVKFQRTAPIVVKNKHVSAGAKQYRYADLAEVITTIRNALGDSGLAFSQSIENNGTTTLVTHLYHESGESIESRMPLPIEQLQPQAVGSLLSYYRRYSLTSLLGVVIDDEDDDGQNAQDSGAMHGTRFVQQLKDSIAKETHIKDGEQLVADKYALNKEYTQFLKNTPKGMCWKVTAIQQAMREFVHDLEGCDGDNFPGFLEDNKFALDACSVALPNWYYGKSGSDVPGIEKRIGDKKIELAKVSNDDPSRYLRA